ncbi:Hypothetical_protein [Hexamita inflata]|uniref:Hypothetical_protein n=1 Tax=Hexamita inflata TaxID=28002 RepID=A0ABP1J6L4_9EUKA
MFVERIFRPRINIVHLYFTLYELVLYKIPNKTISHTSENNIDSISQGFCIFTLATRTVNIRDNLQKGNHQKANTSARQINRQNKFASLNSEDSSSNSGNFSHYQEQPHNKILIEPIIESLIKQIIVLYRKPLKHFNL